MIRVWIRCFVLPSKLLRDENYYRIKNYDGIAVEGIAGKTTIVPTFSAALPLVSKTQEQLVAERNSRVSKRAEAQEARRQARASGNKPTWPKKAKLKGEGHLLCVWGAVVAELLRETGDRLIVALPDGQVVSVKSNRIMIRSDKTADVAAAA